MSILRPSSAKARAFGSAVAEQIRSAEIDRILEEYVSWREESHVAWTAYANWREAPKRERKLAYYAYVAAVDREERAAGVYRERIELFVAADSPR